MSDEITEADREDAIAPSDRVIEQYEAMALDREGKLDPDRAILAVQMHRKLLDHFENVGQQAVADAIRFGMRDVPLVGEMEGVTAHFITYPEGHEPS